MIENIALDCTLLTLDSNLHQTTQIKLLLVRFDGHTFLCNYSTYQLRRRDIKRGVIYCARSRIKARRREQHLRLFLQPFSGWIDSATREASLKWGSLFNGYPVSKVERELRKGNAERLTMHRFQCQGLLWSQVLPQRTVCRVVWPRLLLGKFQFYSQCPRFVSHDLLLQLAEGKETVIAQRESTRLPTA